MKQDTHRIPISALGTLFKYCSASRKVVNGILRDGVVRFTQPWALNDPLEFSPSLRFSSGDDNYRWFQYKGVSFPSVQVWHELNLIEPRINAYGVLSLTDNPYSFEMWSMYADGHKGILIEIDAGGKQRPAIRSGGHRLKIYKVRYVKEFLFDVDSESKRDRIPLHVIRDKIFLRKTRNWRYEHEYRAVRPLSDSPTYRPRKKRKSYRDSKVYLFDFPWTAIKSVAFGVRTSTKNKRYIMNLLAGKAIPFHQAIVYKNENNKMDLFPVDVFGTQERFLEMRPQLFVFDSHEKRFRNAIKISSLEDLPYYSLQPRNWQWHFKRHSVQ